MEPEAWKLEAKCVPVCLDSNQPATVNGKLGDSEEAKNGLVIISERNM